MKSIIAPKRDKGDPRDR